jgi:hypothetical protein
MTKEDIKELVSKVPELDYASFPNPIHGAEVDKYCYIVYKEGLSTNEYLSSAGEIIRGVARTSTMQGLTNYIESGYTYLGMGILHKRIQ